MSIIMRPEEGRFYRQRFPHILPHGATYFITFRLFGSISPKQLLKIRTEHEEYLRVLQEQMTGPSLNQEIQAARKRYFREHDRLLHQVNEGPTYLKDPAVATIFENEIRRFDGVMYGLICYCVMSNHVHLLIEPVEQSAGLNEYGQPELSIVDVPAALKRIKGSSAFYANRLLKRKGNFWAKESYDMYIRNERMYDNVLAYILNNPVDAGIVESWEEYPHSFVRGI